MIRRLAVLSDIHGNIRALDAMLADIARRAIIDIVNLGDCAYGPFDPRPVMNRLLELDLPTVSGNEDRVLVESAAGGSSSQTGTVCAGKLDRRHIEWLARLPRILNFHDALLFHGTPEDDAEYLLTVVDGAGAHVRDRSSVDRLLADHPQRLLLCGHDHVLRAVILGSGRHVVNPGSVGCPAYSDDVPYLHYVENGSPHASYAVVDARSERMTSDLVAVPYDWKAAAREAERNGFPDWAQWIGTGRIN